MSINIILTHRCNMRCSYCFAKDLVEHSTEEMPLQNFETVLRWLKAQNKNRIKLLGGEPTQHSQFEDIVKLLEKYEISATLFTNGVFDHDLIKKMYPTIKNYTINYNAASDESDRQVMLKNIETISRLKGTDIGISYNITSLDFNPSEVVLFCNKYDVKHLRVDIIRPAPSFTNHPTEIDTVKTKKNSILSIVKSAVDNNISVRLDNAWPLCFFETPERIYLQKHAALSGTCREPCDVNVDLTTFRCYSFPLRGPKLTDFKTTEEMCSYFNKEVDFFRWKMFSFDECKECIYMKRRECQGGCLGTKMKEVGTCMQT